VNQIWTANHGIRARGRAPASEARAGAACRPGAATAGLRKPRAWSRIAAGAPTTRGTTRGTHQGQELPARGPGAAAPMRPKVSPAGAANLPRSREPVSWRHGGRRVRGQSIGKATALRMPSPAGCVWHGPPTADETWISPGDPAGAPVPGARDPTPLSTRDPAQADSGRGESARGIHLAVVSSSAAARPAEGSATQSPAERTSRWQPLMAP
jgi:hypothetical protein